MTSARPSSYTLTGGSAGPPPSRKGLGTHADVAFSELLESFLSVDGYIVNAVHAPVDFPLLRRRVEVLGKP